MDLPEFAIEPLIVFVLMMTRVLSMVTALPSAPGSAEFDPIKIGLGFFTALIAYTQYGAVPEGLPTDVYGMAGAIGGEILFGAALGFTVRLALEAVNVTGQLAGFQMGFTIANVVDPVTGDQVSILATFQMLAASLVFFVSGLYGSFIVGVIRSFELVGPGLARPGAASMQPFLRWSADIFVNAISIGAPWILVLLLTKVGFGLVARAFPQMNVFFVGFPVTVALGLGTMAVAMPVFYAVLMSILKDTPEHFWTLVRASMPAAQ